MQINFAHLRERATNGGDINLVVFEASANSNTDAARAAALAGLTSRAVNSGMCVGSKKIKRSRPRCDALCDGCGQRVAHRAQIG